MAAPRAPKHAEIAGNGDFARAAQAQAERFLAAQNRLLNIYSGFMTHWLERRQQAARAAVEATQKALNGGTQPVNVPALYGEWMSGSMQRIAEDMKECQECGSEIAAMLGETMPHWPGAAAPAGEDAATQPAAKE